jgi:hypothetical protein
VNRNFHNFLPSRKAEAEQSMSMLVFWVVASCGYVGGYQRFRGTYCLYLYGWICNPPASPHAVTAQKTDSDTFTAVRNSNLEQKNFSLKVSEYLAICSLRYWLHTVAH